MSDLAGISNSDIGLAIAIGCVLLAESLLHSLLNHQFFEQSIILWIELNYLFTLRDLLVIHLLLIFIPKFILHPILFLECPINLRSNCFGYTHFIIPNFKALLAVLLDKSLATLHLRSLVNRMCCIDWVSWLTIDPIDIMNLGKTIETSFPPYLLGLALAQAFCSFYIHS